MRNAYDTLDDWKSETGLSSTVYSIVFVFYEQLKVIIREFVTVFVGGTGT